MWLLETSTGKLHYFVDPSWENYAILSHVWIPGKEQSFQDLQRLHEPTPRDVWRNRARGLFGRPPVSALDRASEKIRECCAFARARGYRWLWVDTCCIDKTSSAELSEAINSMYQWYAQSGVCYAFLHDVDDEDDPRAHGSQFRASRWFKRGWTLQELIAPHEMWFLSRRWRPIGTKTSLADVIEETTGVDRDVLRRTRPLSSVSVARRMSWAAKRKTTRVEDEAYSLMGIFGVNIPVIYGEGRHAFYRLQEEILRCIPDQSIFAWGPLVYERYDWPCQQLGHAPLPDTEGKPEDATHEYLFATSAAAFEQSAGIVSLPLYEFYKKLHMSQRPIPEYAFTSYGIRTRMPWLLTTRTFTSRHCDSEEDRRIQTVEVVVLACADSAEGLIGLILRAADGTRVPVPRTNQVDSEPIQYKVGARYAAGFVRGAALRCFPGSPRSNPIVFNTTSTDQLLSLYVPSRPLESTLPSYATRMGRRGPWRPLTPSSTRFDCPCEVVIEGWTAARLRKAGYTIATPSGDGLTVQVPGKGSLVHIALSCGQETWFISLTACIDRHSYFLPPPLVAMVSAGSPPCLPPSSAAEGGDHRPIQPPKGCDAVHVQDWPNNTHEFEVQGTVVKLTFESWTDHLDSGTSSGLYGLVIELSEAPLW